MKITGFEINSVIKNVPFNEIGTGSLFMVNNPKDNISENSNLEKSDIKIYVKLGDYFVKYKKSPSVNQLSKTRVNTLELFSQELKLLPESLTCTVIHGCLKCCNTKHDPVLSGEVHYEFDKSFKVVADSEALKVNLQLNKIKLTNHITENRHYGVVIRLGTNLYTSLSLHDYFWDNMIMCSFGKAAKSEFEYAKVVNKIADADADADFSFESRIAVYDRDNYKVKGPYDLIDFHYYGRCEEGIIKSFCF